MAAIWREEGPVAVPPPEPEFAARLRELVVAAESAPDHLRSPRERRLLQRVRAALAAFEAGWVVLGDQDDQPDPARSFPTGRPTTR